MKIIYVSGKYSKGNVDENIALAREAAVELWKRGIGVICPHTNTAHMEREGIPYETFMGGDLEMVRRCDAIYMLSNWQDSPGAIREYQEAVYHRKPVFHRLEDVDRWSSDMFQQKLWEK